LCVDLPATGICASRVLAKVMEESASDSNTARFSAGLLSHLTDLKIADEHVVLRWKLEGPTFTFPPAKDHAYDSSLAQSLRDSEALPEKIPSRGEVVEQFSKH